MREWLALPESRNGVSAGQHNLVSCGAKPPGRAGRKKKPARNPGLPSFHLGAADLVIHAAHATARHSRSSDVEDYSISPQHITLRDMARAKALPRAPQFPEHDASHGAGAGPR